MGYVPAGGPGLDVTTRMGLTKNPPIAEEDDKAPVAFSMMLPEKGVAANAPIAMELVPCDDPPELYPMATAASP